MDSYNKLTYVVKPLILLRSAATDEVEFVGLFVVVEDDDETVRMSVILFIRKFWIYDDDEMTDRFCSLSLPFFSIIWEVSDCSNR